MVKFLLFHYNLNTKPKSVKLNLCAARKRKMEKVGRIMQKEKFEGGGILL